MTLAAARAMVTPATPRPQRAIVLSGGGARGAYEAGVLMAMAERPRSDEPFVDIICGTSVGAVTGAVLAAAIDDPSEAVGRLDEVWSSLSIDQALAFGVDQLASLPRLLLGGKRPAGLFDVRALSAAVGKHVSWPRVAEHLAAGRLTALTVTATHVPTGRPTMFIQRADGVGYPDRVGRRGVVGDALISLPHVLASAAIPVLFAPVAIDGDLYCDGGLRLNTPLGPALRLGAEHVMVIGMSTTRAAREMPSGRYPGVAFLLGKVFNAFLLDHVMGDLDETVRINDFLSTGEAVYGPTFEARLGAESVKRGDPAYRSVKVSIVRPSEDLGVIAADHLRRIRRSVHRVSAARLLLRLLDSREAHGSDLASYLLFDRRYARDLIELGRADGRAYAGTIDGFLGAA